MDVKARDWAQEEISLGDVTRVVRRAKWLILALGFIGAALGYALAHLMPKEYEATITVSPVSATADSSHSGGGLNGLGSALGGLASSLTGMGLQTDTKKAETVAVLQSRALTERYISENNLLPLLYPRAWDSQRHTWNVTDPTKRPTLWKANQYFRGKVREVTTENKTGLVTMAIKWRDPHLAADWANGLVRMTNDYLRGKAIEESERNVRYLNEQALKVDTVGEKQAIYYLLENEINDEMLARGSIEYALKVIDPAQAPERASSPQPIIWTVVGGCLGGLLAFLVAGTRKSLGDSEAQPRA
jgi:uncharacterized protein involved in exopolysaccharide biosynthesis